jgi:hypothetical protein
MERSVNSATKRHGYALIPSGASVGFVTHVLAALSLELLDFQIFPLYRSNDCILNEVMGCLGQR